MTNSNLTSSQNLLSGNILSNIVFIDARVENFQSLLAGLRKNAEAVILDPTKDGVDQITNFLSNHSGAIASVQILSHGSEGNLQIGSTQLNSSNLEQYQQSLQQWFSPLLSQRPDLLLYGCDVASGAIGDNFIQKLSAMTGADVAASVDLTGSVAKGGNWILEKATGVIEAGQAFTQKVRDAYQDVLATFTVTNNNDSGAGSLRDAITQANGTGASDSIDFNIGAGGIQTIKLLTPLPAITTQINLDGTTQPSTGGTPAIELRGDSIPAYYSFADTLSNGLTFWGTGSSNSTARGFVINRFAGNGVKIGSGTEYNGAPGPSGVTIDNNYIGTDVTGTVGLPNSWNGDPNAANAVYAHTSPGTRIINNLISGNATTAIIIRTDSTGVQIIGNYIGTDITGTLPLGNQRAALYVSNSSHNLLFQNNLVAANGYDNLTGGLQAVWHYNSNNLVIRDSTFGRSIDGKPLRNRGYIDSSMNPVESLNPQTISVLAGPAATLINNNINTTPFASPATLPVLTPQAPELTDVINDGMAANLGDLVKNLVSGSIKGDGVSTTSDYGIAITAVAANSNGAWQYSIDNGKEWADLAQALSPSGYGKYVLTANSPSFVSAFLLSPDNKNRIRFLPTNPGFAGTIPNGVTYKAWNQRMAGNGLLMNTGGGRLNDVRVRDTISLNTDSLTVRVIGINKAPELDPLLLQPLTPIVKDPLTNPGTLVTALIPGLAVTDTDVGALKGISVTAVDNSNGTWEYTLNGTTWLAFGSPTPTTARLLAADGTTRVRFVPNAGYEGTPEISFRAWDQTNGVAGLNGNTSINGGLSAFSDDLGKAAIAVGNVIIPSTPTSPSLDPAILQLLKNPPAPPTPAAVIVGEPPLEKSVEKSVEKPDLGGISNPVALGGLDNPFGYYYESIGDDPDCTCENLINQQKSNPVTGTIKGTKREETLQGTSTANTIYGFQANTTILGTLTPDNLYGTPGNDLIRGGKGRDYTQGGEGDDTLYGGRGRDVLRGDQGDDTIYGGRGADFLSGGAGKDTIYGGRGNDFISGGKGSDRLFGGAGNDNLCGCAGDDFIRGGRGNDILNGEKGNDILVGGLGDDTLTGGQGSDRFRLASNSRTDTITDFSVGEDFIELARGLKFSNLQITQGVGATVIGLQPGTAFPSDKPLALLLGVTATSLTPNSFIAV